MYIVFIREDNVSIVYCSVGTSNSALEVGVKAIKLRFI
jgi:hypothetical protein